MLEAKRFPPSPSLGGLSLGCSKGVCVVVAAGVLLRTHCPGAFSRGQRKREKAWCASCLFLPGEGEGGRGCGRLLPVLPVWGILSCPKVSSQAETHGRSMTESHRCRKRKEKTFLKHHERKKWRRGKRKLPCLVLLLVEGKVTIYCKRQNTEEASYSVCVW